MSTDDKSSQEDDAVDLDSLGWDEDLADWADDLDDKVEPKSAPIQDKAARPLYQPPSPDDIFPPRARSSAPAIPIGELDFDDFDDRQDSTRIAAVPQALIDSLVGKDRHQRPTSPPPSGAAIDLDLDGLLDDLEPAAPAVATQHEGTTDERLDPFTDVGDEDVVSSFAPPASKESLPRDAEVLGLDAEDLLTMAEVSAPDPLGLSASAEAPRPSAKAAAPKTPTATPPVTQETGARKKRKLANLAARLKTMGRAGPPPLPPRPGGFPKPGAKLPPIPKPATLRARLPPRMPPPRKPPPRKPPPRKPPPRKPPPPRPTAPSVSPAPIAGPEVDPSVELDELLDSSPPVAEAQPPVAPAALAPSPPDGDDDIDALLDGLGAELDLPALDADDPTAGEVAPAALAPATSSAAAAGSEVLSSEDPAPGDDRPRDSAPEDSAPGDSDTALDADSEADDDDDAEVVFETDDRGAEDWDEEELAAIEAAEAEEAAAAAASRGTKAARRSIRTRKPRSEHFPMVGRSAEALGLRRRLLEKMSESREGALRARLLDAAGELAEQAGDRSGAHALYARALTADGDDVVALRALRRHAVRREDWTRLTDLFEAEAKLDLSSEERASAYCGLAELHLSRSDNPAAAERAAAAGLAANPSSVAASLLLAEARWRQDQLQEASGAFAGIRELWDDPDARAALAIEEARTKEAGGDREAARALFAWANDVDPEALDGWFGRARTSSRKDGDPKGAVEALETIAAYCQGGLRDAILTRASRVATRLLSDPGLGVRLLDGATGVASLQAKAEASLLSGERPLVLESMEAWANAAGSTDRALALVRLAEIRAREGDLDGAEQALRDAALADGTLGTIRVVREVIARRSGDVSRLVAAAEDGGALAGAARLAREPGALERERELLDQAVAEGQSLIAADVLSLDVAASQSDQPAIDLALRRQADRLPPEQRMGSLLSMAERAIDRDDLNAAEALLAEARHNNPGDPLVLNPLARLVLRRDAAEAAALWMEEAAQCTGERSAHAATQAGRLLIGTGGDAIGAFRKALEAAPGYRPAAWALRPLALDLGDTLTLGELYSQLAESAPSPDRQAGQLVRGALLRAEADPEAAGGLLEQARALTPQDPVLQSLVMRLAAGTSAAQRALILVQAAAHAPDDLARVFQLRAAAALEEAGQPSSAAAQYRAVLEKAAADPFASAGLDRAETAGGAAEAVLSRLRAQIQDSDADDQTRATAWFRLAELERVVQIDTDAAARSLESLIELAPAHVPSLRALQRHYAERRQRPDALRIAGSLAAHLQEGVDVTAQLRLAHRLALYDPEAPGDVNDELLLALAGRADLDVWLAPRLLAAARAAEDLDQTRRAASGLADLLGAADERAAMRLRAAELEEGPARIAMLREAAHSSPTHPLASAELATALERAGDKKGAAESWEIAARGTATPRRAAAQYYRAGVIWEELGDSERARAALTHASERDVTHADIYDRLRGLLGEADDKSALADLYARRLSAGGDTAEIFDLYVKQSKLREQTADLSGAKAALRSALALQPERVEALRSLAKVCLKDEDWRGAAEVLIRIARIRKEREELRWVFFTLAEIYDVHMPDPRRAEAAYRRVLKLFPNDLPAMERLAQLYEREGQAEKAAEILNRLAAVEVDPERNRDHRLKLALIYEAAGDLQQADATLEDARRVAPTDLAVLRSLADFRRRHHDDAALAMHLRRAVNDFRHALKSDLADASAWPGLIEVLRWSEQEDAAAAAASAAAALGLADPLMSKLLDAGGGAPGARHNAGHGNLDDLLVPEQLSVATRAVFRLAGEALEKTLPLSLSDYGAVRLGRRDTSIRPMATEIARWLGITHFELYLTDHVPRACLPVFSNPCTLLIGQELLNLTDDREKTFVLVRAFQMAKAQLAVMIRAQPAERLALMAGLVTSYNPHHVQPGADPAHVAEAARRVTKHLPSGVTTELGTLVLEMAGRPGYDPNELAMAASRWGNRVGLLATGSGPTAISALAKLSGENALPADPPARLQMIRRFAEASLLLQFAISDAHFNARQRALGRTGA